MKCGYATICGLPNAGKSTLINKLIGEKIAVVSPKPQTTRRKMVYLLTQKDSQIVLLDTPGFFPDAKNKLDEYLLSQIDTAKHDCDIIVYITADKNSSDREKIFLESLSGPDMICVINKIDTFNEEELKERTTQLKNMGIFKGINTISALLGNGIDKFVTSVIDLLPEEENYLYDPELLSLERTRDIVEELIRGELFLLLEQELPYVCGVKLEDMKTRDNGMVYVNVIIFCERTSQKKIIIGSKGRNLKKIGASARRAVEEFLGSKVYLDIWIKVYPKWRKNEPMLNNLGYKKD